MTHPEIPFPPQSHFDFITIGPEGSRRLIGVPDDEARKFHRRLQRDLKHSGLELPFATGGVPGRQLIDNVAPHASNRHFFMLDLSKAFPSVDGHRLARQLTSLGIFSDEESAQSKLGEYCLDPRTGGLILGAPASPLLFNIYCAPLDDALAEASWCHGLTYTRYLDDLTFSAPRSDGPIGKHKRKLIRGAIMADGWKIAHHKSRVESLDNGPVTITGISLYPTGYWKLSPDLTNKIIATFDAYEAKLAAGTITTHDIGVLDGHNSILTTTYDPRRGQPTPIEKQLRDRYKDLKARSLFVTPVQDDYELFEDQESTEIDWDEVF